MMKSIFFALCMGMSGMSWAGNYWDLAPSASSVTLKMVGGINIAASSSTINTPKISLDGVSGAIVGTSISGSGAGLTGVNISSSVIFASGANQGAATNCIVGSTLTVTTGGGRAKVTFNGLWSNNTAWQNQFALVKVDGVPSIRLNAWSLMASQDYYPLQFSYVTDILSAAPHSFCVVLWSTSGVITTLPSQFVVEDWR